MAEKYVTYEELPDIIKDAVKQALEEYEHECIMHLKPGDSEHVRDMVGAIREIGDGDLGRGIVKVRDNHKFVASLHAAALKIGWGVIILTVSILSTLGIIVAGVWKQTSGNGIG